jgi:hypothetical protein
MRVNLMENLPVPLKVAILDTDIIGATVLKSLIETKEDIIEVKKFSNIQNVKDEFQKDNFNSLFIDLISIGVPESIELIKFIRTEFPIVPICLFSTSYTFSNMFGVDEYWKNRFRHYYKLRKDQPVDILDQDLSEILYYLSVYLQGGIAQNKVKILRKKLEEATLHGITIDQKNEIEASTDFIEKTLESQRNQNPQQRLVYVPGVKTDQLEQIVNNTLKEATKSLKLTIYVNIAVLTFGSILVIISFIFALVTNRWEAVAFGGFGIVGIITSLIANPLKSIGTNAQRLVQVQVAYFSFLSQLSILNEESEKGSVIERSRQLECVMSTTLTKLGENYGK